MVAETFNTGNNTGMYVPEEVFTGVVAPKAIQSPPPAPTDSAKYNVGADVSRYNCPK